MQNLLKSSPIIQALVFGFIFLIPLIALEVVNRWRFNEGFPFAVFIFSWILQALFILLLTPIVKTYQSGKSFTTHPISLLLKIAGLVLIAYIWQGWIVDQWPCIMGVPHCD